MHYTNLVQLLALLIGFGAIWLAYRKGYKAGVDEGYKISKDLQHTRAVLESVRAGTEPEEALRVWGGVHEHIGMPTHNEHTVVEVLQQGTYTAAGPAVGFTDEERLAMQKAAEELQGRNASPAQPAEIDPHGEVAWIERLRDMLTRVECVQFYYNEDGNFTQHAGTFQTDVYNWMQATFGPVISKDKRERCHRFLEEALELVQAGGLPFEECFTLLNYVYGRPVRELPQEMGGVMVTLAALGLAHGLKMDACARSELKRCWANMEKIRAKQASKRNMHNPGSPLPAPSLRTPSASPPQSSAPRSGEPRQLLDTYAPGDGQASAVAHQYQLPRAPYVIEAIRRLRAKGNIVENSAFGLYCLNGSIELTAAQIIDAAAQME